MLNVKFGSDFGMNDGMEERVERLESDVKELKKLVGMNMIDGMTGSGRSGNEPNVYY